MMKYRNVSLVGSSLFCLACLGLPGCGSNDPTTLVGGGGSSGASNPAVGGLGGAATTGGSSTSNTTTTSNTGGSLTSSSVGGASSVGGTSQSSNSSTGGSTATTSAGGTSSSQGGSATGGSSTTSSGGAGVGGTSKGGSSAGGAATGGAAQGGNSAGGASAGGASAGGTSAAGSSSNADNNGKCGLTWAAGGANGAPAVDATVTPTNASDVWTFAFGRYKFVVSAKTAGRITEFSINGKNIIFPAMPEGDSTFAPSPQSAYQMWPPPAALDSSPYTATMTDNILSLVGPTSSELNISFNKRFWVNGDSGVVTLEYTIVNQASASANWAPWEITRVPPGGFTFAPKGPGTRVVPLQQWETAMPLTNGANGINWLDYAAKSSSLTKDNYLVEFDGAEGWLAHAQSISSTPLLLVKSFPDAKEADLPSDQNEIQLWTNGTGTPKRIEVEQQGAQKAIASKAKLVWTVHWALCELPSASVLAVDNADLVKYARAHAVAQP